MTAVAGWLEGVGVLGPGLADWPAAARVLRGEERWQRAATLLPLPQRLPAAERRRTGTVVKLALAVGLEAVANARADGAKLPAVFSSSGGEGANCHEICEVLASGERLLSPTRFHNSVHNAAAGYWGIAMGATAACNALCAYDASFAAGLLEALTQVSIERAAVLLVAYDAGYPEPLNSTRPIPDPFGVALVLAPEAGERSLARLEVRLSEAPADVLEDGALESLRTSIPAARSLSLLASVARRASGCVIIDYLERRRMAVEVSACP